MCGFRNSEDPSNNVITKSGKARGTCIKCKPPSQNVEFTLSSRPSFITVCVSVPTWNSISFLNVGTGADQVRYGVFGYTGSAIGIGYDFLPVGDANLNTTIIRNLTKTLILHPIGAGLAGLSFLFGLCGASYHRAGTVFMSLLAGLAMLVTLVAFIVDIALFTIIRDRIHDVGTSAQYGVATWLTLAALVSLLLGFCASACGVFGR
ncbi:hypothetical protein H0H93_016457, partial [Arthromyces matolae]